MGNKADNKFTCVIKNFSFMNHNKIFSDQFLIGGCKWRLRVQYGFSLCPKRNLMASLSLFLMVADAKSLPSGWRRHVKFSFTIVNQIAGKSSLLRETQHWFDHEKPDWGFRRIIPLDEFMAKTGGFIVNGEVKIVVDVEILQVVGKLDVAEESEEATQSAKKVKLNDDGVVDVNGFQVLSSQVEFVNRIFEKYPDIALELRARNQHLRTACMNVLLSLIETLCQSPQELSNEDLVEADNALAYIKDAGFKVDWLEKKLEEVKVKKEEEQSGEIRMQELEEELKDCKQKCSGIEALLEKVKTKVLAARTHLTLDEFF